MTKYFKHKTAEIGKKAKIGEGSKVWQNSIILDGAVLGKNCNIGHNCFIEGRAKLGNGVKLKSNIDVWDLVILEDYVFVGPSAVFTNDKNPRAKYPKAKNPKFGKLIETFVREGVTIGANATIICGITIGKWAMVGAGAVVREDVSDYSIVVGSPAKTIGFICECGNKLNFENNNRTECKICKRKFKKENAAKGEPRQRREKVKEI